MTLRRCSILALLVAGFVLTTAVPAAPAHVPNGFVGVISIDGPLWPITAPEVNLDRQFDKMVANGVENVRVVFDWAAAEPYKKWSDVPASQAGQFTDVNGVPVNFTQLDKLVELASTRRMTLLPVVLYAPGWDAAKHPSNAFAIPRRDAPYGQFMAALVQRYGRHGTFWQSGHHPKVPITMWQVWNEPNIKVFWFKQPFQRSYVALLKAAHSAITSRSSGPRWCWPACPTSPGSSWRASTRSRRPQAVRRRRGPPVHQAAPGRDHDPGESPPGDGPGRRSHQDHGRRLETSWP